METERKGFEAAMWTYYLDLKAKGWSAPEEGERVPPALFWREESGKYGVLSVEAAWNGWQMARKSVVPAPVAQLSEPPEGWVLVPIAPTIEMCEAGREAELFAPSARSSLVVYRAMLAAAPTTPKEAS